MQCDGSTQETGERLVSSRLLTPVAAVFQPLHAVALALGVGAAGQLTYYATTATVVIAHNTPLVLSSPGLPLMFTVSCERCS